MSHKLNALAGGVAVAALAIAGAVAAQAADASQVVKVGYFEGQDESETSSNPTPAAWFSEKEDVASALSIAEDGLVLGSTSHFSTPSSVGLNLIVDEPLDPEVPMAIDAEGEAFYSLVITSDQVGYMRITAVDSSLELWSGSGYFPVGGGPKVKMSQVRSLEWWASQDFLAGKNAVLWELEKELAAAQKAASKAESAAGKAAEKLTNLELKAAAEKPWTISGTVKVGKTLKAKGKAPKGMAVK